MAQIPCYYINMARSTDRRTLMEQQAEALGLDLMRLDGVDGATLQLSDTPPLTDYAARIWGMSSSEIGCWLSHKNAWQKIAEADAPYGVVFEDDVILAKAAAVVLQNADWIAPDVSCIKLDLSHIDAFHQTLNPINLGNFAISRPVSILCSTGGYILSKGAAKILLQQAAIIGAPIDIQMFAMDDPSHFKLAYHQLHPAICAQANHLFERGEVSSQIHDSTIDHGGPWGKEPPLAFGWRKVLREMNRPLRGLEDWFFERVRRTHMKLRHGATRRVITFEKPVMVQHAAQVSSAPEK